MQRKPFAPIVLLSAEEIERDKRRMRLTVIVLYTIGLPLIFVLLWFALS
jgi:hypothetical protein